MSRFLLVCLGGAAGTGARFLMSEWAASALGTSFPWGTFFVNSIGSFLIAMIAYAGLESASITPTTRLVLTTGVMGGFTTYSSFSFETMRYVEAGHWGLAAMYVGATWVVCLAACFAGWLSARAILG